MYVVEEVLDANLSFSIGQTAIVRGRQKLDKKRISVRISLDDCDDPETPVLDGDSIRDHLI
jgi:hypothetical protein